MIQWAGVVLTVIGLAYAAFKDYRRGEFDPPPKTHDLTVEQLPVQYCLMAYDPNTDRVWYLHENNQWYANAPEQRKRLPPQTQRGQAQGSTAVGIATGTPREAGYQYRYATSPPAYTQRY